MDIACEVCPGFTLEEHQKAAFADIFQWMLQLPGRLDPRKGLWIWGNIGTGKTTLLRVIDRALTRIHNRTADDDFQITKWITFRTALDLADCYVDDGPLSIRRAAGIQRLAIDDVGVEPIAASHYGTPSNVIGELLMRRYELMGRNDRLRYQTFATTNMAPDELAGRYGERVYDRLGEMFNFVQFGGFTRRPEIK